MRVFLSTLSLLLLLATLPGCPAEETGTAPGKETPDESLDPWEKSYRLGVRAYGKKKPDEAAKHFLEAIARLEGKKKKTIPLSRCLNNLGAVRESQNRPEDAENYYKRALKLLKPAGPSPDLAATQNNLAILSEKQNESAAAETYYKESLKTLELSVGELHPAFQNALLNYATFLKRQNRPKEAKILEKRARTLAEKRTR